MDGGSQDGVGYAVMGCRDGYASMRDLLVGKRLPGSGIKADLPASTGYLLTYC